MTAPALSLADDEPTPDVGASLLAQVREKRRAAGAARTIDLAIPGYDGDLIARYRLVDALGEGKLIGEKIRRDFKTEEDRNYWGAVDVLITACEGFYLRNAETGELEPLDPDGQGPVCYDHRLAKGLELDTTTARDTLTALFNGQTIRILAHAVKLAEWMQDPDSAVTLGEA